MKYAEGHPLTGSPVSGLGSGLADGKPAIRCQLHAREGGESSFVQGNGANDERAN